MSVHPHDLALREGALTGSYTAALLNGRLAQALAYARLWRRLAERATWQPLCDAAAMPALLTALGERPRDGDALESWLIGLRRTFGSSSA